MSENIIKFRATGEEQLIIDEMREKLGLNNDSAVIRLLLRQGSNLINQWMDNSWIVAQHLKFSEIDFLTTSLNINLKNRKRELYSENKDFMPSSVPPKNKSCGHETILPCKMDSSSQPNQ